MLGPDQVCVCVCVWVTGREVGRCRDDGLGGCSSCAPGPARLSRVRVCVCVPSGAVRVRSGSAPAAARQVGARAGAPSAHSHSHTHTHAQDERNAAGVSRCATPIAVGPAPPAAALTGGGAAPARRSRWQGRCERCRLELSWCRIGSCQVLPACSICASHLARRRRLSTRLVAHTPQACRKLVHACRLTMRTGARCVTTRTRWLAAELAGRAAPTRPAGPPPGPLLTCCHAQEVLGAGAVHLDVTGAHEVLVAAQRQVALLAALKLDQRLAIAPPLAAQTQADAAPGPDRACGCRRVGGLVGGGPRDAHTHTRATATTHLAMLSPTKKSAMSCSLACQGSPRALMTHWSASWALTSLAIGRVCVCVCVFAMQQFPG